jgi:vacuolar-type H+-ATPase subunit E/Vma4
MARGWESKSVETQIDMAEDRSAIARAKVLSQVSLDLLRKKESILMSRTRVVRDLENAQNPRYRAVLSKALADLDAQLSTLAPE